MKNYEKKLQTITKIVCRKYKVEESLLYERNRLPELAETRFIVWYIGRKFYNKQISYSKLGVFFNRDHATVISGIKRINGFLQTDNKFKKKYNRILKICKLALTEKTGEISRMDIIKKLKNIALDAPENIKPLLLNLASKINRAKNIY